MDRDVVYLDYQATTPVDRRVLDTMLPFLTRQYANPASPHQPGRRAAEALQRARRQVQRTLGARRDTEVVFTSGATEGNHLAIVGAATVRASTSTGHVVTTAVEHKSVLAACDQLVAAGFAVTRIGVDREGRVDPARVAAAITPQTALVSVMYANNEIGTIQPIPQIAAITRAAGVLLHVDAVQAIGALPVDVEQLGVDLLTISAHKVYGPKGVGALYVRHGTRIRPQLVGSQEHGLRAGTANVAGAVGLAESLRLLDNEREPDVKRVAALRDQLAEQLLAALPDACVNGSRTARLPGNLSLTIPGVLATDVIASLPDLAISAGSACTSGQDSASHVLTAIGLDDARAAATLRLSLGRFSRDEEIAYAASRLSAAARRAPRVPSSARGGV
jgi:cysteine desulfurase